MQDFNGKLPFPSHFNGTSQPLAGVSGDRFLHRAILVVTDLLPFIGNNIHGLSDLRLGVNGGHEDSNPCIIFRNGWMQNGLCIDSTFENALGKP